MKTWFRKTILFAWIAALGLASLPLVSVAAQGTQDPPPPQGPVTNEKLEQVWARQLRAYERLGQVEDAIARAQRLIDRANADGKDVSAVQAALDTFKVAAKEAKPIYESMHGIVNGHLGFDAQGKVTDPEKAKETVRTMGEKLKEIKEAMGGTGKALHEAIKAFREANPRPEKVPTPAGG